MTSLRHKEPGAPVGSDDALLDAARDSVLAVGWRRSTLTEVARRAGVSRMTLYRRWPDMATLLADLMTREWGALVAQPGAPRSPDRLADRVGDRLADRVADAVALTVASMRGNELFAKILHVDPELLLPYLLERRGRTQETLLGALEEAVAEGQHDGSVRQGPPALLARGVLLASYGFALSAPTMADREVTVSGLDAELRVLVERYLAG